MRNIEIKVRVPSLDEIRRSAVTLGARPIETYADTDAYFHVPHGRFKLRSTAGKSSATLISYDRPNELHSRISTYRLFRVDDGAAMRAMLAQALGVLVEIKKRRELLLFGATRIHLDQVDRLGHFVELETVLGEIPESDAPIEHEHVARGLHLERHELVPVSYSDLLLSAE